MRGPLALPSVEPLPLAARIDETISRSEALAAVGDRWIELGFDPGRLARFLALEESRRGGLDLREDGGVRGILGRAGRFLYREHLPTEPAEFARPASSAMERAVARCFASAASDPSWVADAFPSVDVSEVGEGSLEARLLEALYLAARAEFETEAHRNPGRDLDELWWNLLEKWTGVRREPDASSWATDPLLTGGSFGARSELLARAIAAQIRHYLVFATGQGPERSTPARLWIEHVFRRGASAPWSAIVHDLTNEPPNPDYWFRDLAEGTSDESLLRQRRRREATERLREAPGRR